MSVRGEIVIRGGGGESTSNSDEDELERDRLWLLDLDRDFVLVTLKFEGESHVISDLAWYTPLSSSSDSGFSIIRLTPNLISSWKQNENAFYFFCTSNYWKIHKEARCLNQPSSLSETSQKQFLKSPNKIPFPFWMSWTEESLPCTNKLRVNRTCNFLNPKTTWKVLHLSEPEGLSHSQRTQSAIIQRDLFFSPSTPRAFISLQLLFFYYYCRALTLLNFYLPLLYFVEWNCGGWKINIECCFWLYLGLSLKRAKRELILIIYGVLWFISSVTSIWLLVSLLHVCFGPQHRPCDQTKMQKVVNHSNCVHSWYQKRNIYLGFLNTLQNVW